MFRVELPNQVILHLGALCETSEAIVYVIIYKLYFEANCSDVCSGLGWAGSGPGPGP